MQDPPTAEVHVITAEESDPYDSSPRAGRDPAHAKGPCRSHPFPSAQRHKVSPRPRQPSRPRLRVIVSQIQWLPVRTPPLAEVLDDLLSLFMADLNKFLTEVPVFPLDDGG